MVLFEGRQFAERLLRHERADDLRNPPRCRACGHPMWHANERQRPEPGWYWFCGRTVDGTRCRHSEPFVNARRAIGPRQAHGRGRARPRD